MSARTVAGLNLFYKHNKHSSIRHEGIMKKKRNKTSGGGNKGMCMFAQKKNHRNKKNDKKLFMCDALFFLFQLASCLMQPYSREGMNDCLT